MKILTNILTSFFSVLLVAALVIAPIGSFAASVVEESTVNEFVEALNLKENLTDGITIDGKTNKEFETQLKKSKFYNELFTKCSEYMTAPLYEKKVTLTEQDIIEVADKHIDELYSIIESTIPNFFIETDAYGDSYIIPESDVKDKIHDNFAEIAPTIIKDLNSLRNDSNIKDLAETTKTIRTIHMIIFIVIIALTALIFILNFRKLNGFIWLGIDYGIAALITSVLTGVVKKAVAGLVSEINIKDYLSGIKNFITTKIDDIYSEKITLYVIIAAACLLIAIVYKVYRATSLFQHKKATKPAKTSPQSNYNGIPNQMQGNINYQPQGYAPQNTPNQVTYQQNTPSQQYYPQDSMNSAPQQMPSQVSPPPKDFNPYAPELPNNNN